MAISPSSPLPGAAMTGLTSPTYTLVEDTSPSDGAKQWYVSALGGTQTGADSHQVSKPFTLTIERPRVLRNAGVANPSNGVIYNVPNNVYKVRVRKGVDIDSSGDNTRTSIMECKIPVPAGSDVNDIVNVRAAISCLIGALSDISSDLGDSVATGAI